MASSIALVLCILVCLAEERESQERTRTGFQDGSIPKALPRFGMSPAECFGRCPSLSVFVLRPTMFVHAGWDEEPYDLGQKRLRL